MEPTPASAVWPDSWRLTALPDVDDVRPRCCDACQQPARRGSRIVLHGHGSRVRCVVVLPSFTGGRAQLGECWERRYLCTACGAVQVVLPDGVLPRYLYSAAAIVTALFLVARRPVGSGLSQAEAYDRQGMLADVRPLAMLEPTYRWRSLDRWAQRARDWWSGWTGPVSSLLVLFLERSGGQGLEAAVRIAVDGHVRWGCPM